MTLDCDLDEPVHRMNYLWRIELRRACFGIEVDHAGFVVGAAPIAASSVTRPLLNVVHYFEQNGARFQRIRENKQFTIISGGQTGADQGAIHAARWFGTPYEGWLPLGRWTEDGPFPDDANLRAYNEVGYRPRTELNVLEGDGTVIFTQGPMTPGSKQTKYYAERHGRPCLWINLLQETRPVPFITNFVKQHGIRALNVAGSRESKAPGIEEAVRLVIIQALARVA